MILFISGRCDVVAYYTDWFMKRYAEGFVDVRNPYYPAQVSRIYFEHVEAMVFCTKNPWPIIDQLHKIKQPIIFHVTLTPYKKEIEPNVIDKRKMIEGIKRLSAILPKENIYVRYDPVFISETYSIDYHLRAFERLCTCLEGSVEHIIISFLDEYKNVRKNRHISNNKRMSDEDIKRIGEGFSKSAARHHMQVQTCAEQQNLCEYGFIQEDCMSKKLAFLLTGKAYRRWHARGNKCNCVEMVDIGVYNSCQHLCRYCYANFDETKIMANSRQHDDLSTMLIGSLLPSDIIKERK